MSAKFIIKGIDSLVNRDTRVEGCDIKGDKDVIMVKNKRFNDVYERSRIIDSIRVKFI